MLKKHQDPKSRPRRGVPLTDKPFTGMMISLAGRLTRTHVCALVAFDSIFDILLVSLNFLLRKEVCLLFVGVQQYWKSKIDKNGGKVANSVMGEYI